MPAKIQRRCRRGCWSEQTQGGNGNGSGLRGVWAKPKDTYLSHPDNSTGPESIFYPPWKYLISLISKSHEFTDRPYYTVYSYPDSLNQECAANIRFRIDTGRASYM